MSLPEIELTPVDRVHTQRARAVTPVGQVCQLGVVQFHEQRELREQFYHVVRDLEGWTVDVWLLDIKNLLAAHGYEMTIKRVK